MLGYSDFLLDATPLPPQAGCAVQNNAESATANRASAGSLLGEAWTWPQGQFLANVSQNSCVPSPTVNCFVEMSFQ